MELVFRLIHSSRYFGNATLDVHGLRWQQNIVSFHTVMIDPLCIMPELAVILGEARKKSAPLKEFYKLLLSTSMNHRCAHGTCVKWSELSSFIILQISFSLKDIWSMMNVSSSARVYCGCVYINLIFRCQRFTTEDQGSNTKIFFGTKIKPYCYCSQIRQMRADQSSPRRTRKKGLLHS